MIDRDPKFEIQYLISLVIAIVGSATAPMIQNAVDPAIASLLILFIMVHILMYTVGYTLENASGFQTDLVSSLNKATQWTLVLISISFLYFIGTIISRFIWELYTFADSEVSILIPTLVIAKLTIPIPSLIITFSAENIFVYGVPFLFLIILILIFVYPEIKKVKVLRNIDITLHPDNTRVFSNFRDGNTIRVKIENNTGKIQKVDVHLEFPEEVEYMHNEDKTGEEVFVDNEVEINNNRWYLEFFDLKYVGDERKTGVITAEITHEYGTSTREIDLILVPN